MTKRYVIAGAGAAGVSAAEAIRRRDPDGEIALLAEERFPPYSRPLLTDYIAGRLAEGELAMRPDGHWAELDVDLRLGTKVERVDPDGGRVVLAGGGSLPYDTLLVATGARPVVPPVLAGCPAVTALRSLADARRIRESALAGRRIVVVGGGALGVKAACALTLARSCVAGADAASSLTLVEALPRLLTGMADAEAALLAARRLMAAGLDVRCGVTIEEVIYGGSVTLVLSDGARREADLVVACTGVTPETDPVRGVVEVRRGVVVDRSMRTTAEGVWAAGDVAEAPGLLDDEAAVTAIWPHATAQGKVAGAVMAGRAAEFAGGLRRNVVDVLGLPLASAGVVDPPAAPGWSVLAEGSGLRYSKLVLRDGVPVGALVVGDVELAGRLQSFVRKGIPRQGIPIQGEVEGHWTRSWFSNPVSAPAAGSVR